jgi:hypothetical protein
VGRGALDWRLWTLAALALVFAASTGFLLFRPAAARPPASPAGPTVRQFWSQVFPGNRPTDIVLDDAATGLFQELTGHPLALADYFDRGYQRRTDETGLDREVASSLLLRRHSSYANAGFLWKLSQIPGVDYRASNLRFAREYSFRELKADNALLLGNDRSNPWIEAFLPRLSIHWIYDGARGVYYPVDHPASAADSIRPEERASPEGYFSVSLLPNLGGVGSVLIVSGTGGSALNAGADFLADERAMTGLRHRLPGSSGSAFPGFEALIAVKGRSTLPQDAKIILCRPL